MRANRSVTGRVSRVRAAHVALAFVLTMALSGSASSSSWLHIAQMVPVVAGPGLGGDVHYHRGGFTIIADMATDNHGTLWAVSEAKLIVYDGAVWRVAAVIPDMVQPGRVEQLHAIAIEGESGWAVGDGCSLLRFSSGSWSFMRLPVREPCTLWGVDITPTGEAWITGQTVTDGRLQVLIARHAGTSWELIPSPLSQTGADGSGVIGTSVAMASDSDGWISVASVENGDGRYFLHWDGRRWNLVEFPATQTPSQVIAMDAQGSDNVWAVGGLVAQGDGADGACRYCQLVLHFNGTQWNVVREGEGAPFFDVETSGADVWAVASAGLSGEVWHGVGGQIAREFCCHLGDLLTIEILDADELWAAGYGSPMHRQNGVWSEWGRIANPSSVGLTSISRSDDGDAWAAGPGQSLLRVREGKWLEAGDIGVGAGWPREVVSLGRNDVWIGVSQVPGEPGRVFHGDGTQWTGVNLDTPSGIVDLVGTSKQLWALASDPPENGVYPGARQEADIFQYIGASWTKVHTIDRALFALHVFADGELWAVGQGLVHRRGVTWVAEDMPATVVERLEEDAVTSIELFDVGFANKDRGWAIGRKFVLKYEHGDWRPVTGMCPEGGDEGIRVDDFFLALEVDDQGDVWIISAVALWYGSSTGWQRFVMPRGSSREIQYRALTPFRTETGPGLLLAGGSETVAEISSAKLAEITGLGTAVQTETLWLPLVSAAAVVPPTATPMNGAEATPTAIQGEDAPWPPCRFETRLTPWPTPTPYPTATPGSLGE